MVRVIFPLYWYNNKLINLYFNPLNAKLNSICHLLALLGAHPVLHISRIRVNFKGEASTSVPLFYTIVTLTDDGRNYRPKHVVANVMNK